MNDAVRFRQDLNQRLFCDGVCLLTSGYTRFTHCVYGLNALEEEIRSHVLQARGCESWLYLASAKAFATKMVKCEELFHHGKVEKENKCTSHGFGHNCSYILCETPILHGFADWGLCNMAAQSGPWQMAVLTRTSTLKSPSIMMRRSWFIQSSCCLSMNF